MIEAEQFELPLNCPQAAFELQLREQYEENRRVENERYGPDRYVIFWCCQCHDREWWDGLPEYKRRMFRDQYAYEQERVEHGGKMRTCEYVNGMAEEAYQQDKKLAEEWAEDLRAAFLDGQPCPIRPLKGLFGNEWILRWAFELAQVNPASLNAAEPQQKEEELV